VDFLAPTIGPGVSIDLIIGIGRVILKLALQMRGMAIQFDIIGVNMDIFPNPFTFVTGQKRHAGSNSIHNAESLLKQTKDV
jgi:hypothetical protein